MIRFKACSFRYKGDFLLKDFHLSIAASEKVVLYGASGSGKSTLLHALMGFVTPERGEISIQNAPLTEESVAHLRQSIAWVPQEFSLPYTTVSEAIYAPFEFKNNRGLRPREAAILELFEELGLEPHLYRVALSELSGGQRQRVMLVTALLLKKPILLLDEPTSALDALAVSQVIGCLKRQSETTIIAVSHDDRFIESFDKKIEIISYKPITE